MSLTATDLDQIRKIIYLPLEAKVDGLQAEMRQGFSEVSRELGHLNRRVDGLEKKVDKFDGRITASENDIKEIYGMLPAKPR